MATTSTIPAVATMIFDNAGGLTVQLHQGGSVWAHYYDDSDEQLRAAAGDVHAALLGQDIEQYDGDEHDAKHLRPTTDEIRNGGYRVFSFVSEAEFSDWVTSKHDGQWRSVRVLAEIAARKEL